MEKFNVQKSAGAEIERVAAIFEEHEKEKVPKRFGTANYHLYQKCHMKCGFCFATYADVTDRMPKGGHLGREKALQIVDQIADYGFEKINFAGGEPFLLMSYLPDLVKEAKSKGCTTSVVTNGELILRGLQKGENILEQFDGTLDMAAISIDSFNPATLQTIGRTTKKGAIDEEGYRLICQAVKDAGVVLKVNTVVNSANYEEDHLRGFIDEIQPKRWKVFKTLPVDGSGQDSALFIDDEQYESFLERNYILTEPTGFISGRYEVRKQTNQMNNIAEVPTILEDNDTMSGSYVMIDPRGCLYAPDPSGRTGAAYVYSQPILDPEVGIEKALTQVSFDLSKFRRRDGDYRVKSPDKSSADEVKRRSEDAAAWARRNMGAKVTELLICLYENVPLSSHLEQIDLTGIGTEQAPPRLAIYAPLFMASKQKLIKELHWIARWHPNRGAEDILYRMMAAWEEDKEKFRQLVAEQAQQLSVDGLTRQVRRQLVE